MKKIFLSCALIASCAFAKAAGTMYYLGAYVGSTEVGSTCYIICNPSTTLYCYAITSTTTTQNQSIIDNIQPTGIQKFANTPWETGDEAGITTGAFVTIQTYDDNQNIVSTYTGNYQAMQFSYNADGSITSYISLQQQ